jgi:hypothetical protein
VSEEGVQTEKRVVRESNGDGGRGLTRMTQGWCVGLFEPTAEGKGGRTTTTEGEGWWCEKGHAPPLTPVGCATCALVRGPGPPPFWASPPPLCQKARASLGGPASICHSTPHRCPVSTLASQRLESDQLRSELRLFGIWNDLVVMGGCLSSSSSSAGRQVRVLVLGTYVHPCSKAIELI